MPPCHRSLHYLFFGITVFSLFVLPSDGVRGEETAATTGAVENSPLPKEKDHREIVIIDEIKYPVPPPWTGHKLTVPVDTIPSLQLIPPELTLKRTAIHLRNAAIEPLKAMAAAAKADNITLLIDSGYRSARYQRTIFRQFREKGRSFNNIARSVAPPGYSEHMLGTVVDFHPSNPSFSRSATYQWLRRHAAAYGFAETYSRHNHKNQPWEPWHWKFEPPEGKELSRNISNEKGRAESGEPSPEASVRPSIPVISIRPVRAIEPVIDYQ